MLKQQWQTAKSNINVKKETIQTKTKTKTKVSRSMGSGKKNWREVTRNKNGRTE